MITLAMAKPSIVPIVHLSSIPASRRRATVVALRGRATSSLPGPPSVRHSYSPCLGHRGADERLMITYENADFQTVLTQDPDSTEAKDALRETCVLMIQRGNEEDYVDSDDESPDLDAIKIELESVSDSSDWSHEGNGIPCRFYNHDGCLRGTDCRFSHAPDHKSVRDRLYVLEGFFGLPTCLPD